MKQEFANVYDLIWAMNRIAKSLCDMNSGASGDLMIDAISVNRMNDEDNIRYWHVERSFTWMADDENQFDKNVFVIHYDAANENPYSIEQIK